jgi:hypothetical protein
MKSGRILLVAFVILTVAVVSCGPTAALAASGEPELSDQIDTLFERASTPANQQKFLSILIWVLFGGVSTYSMMRGLKKIVHTS